MGKPSHPLVEDSFAPLRAESDKLLQAFSALGQQVKQFMQQLTGQAGGGTRGKPGGRPNTGAADEMGRVAASTDKAASSAERFDRAIGKASASMNGLQRAAKGIGDIAELLGFESAAQKANDLAKALSAVRDVVGGLVAARGVLIPMGALIAVTLTGVGALQEAIYQATGEMPSLANAIRLMALGVEKFVVQGVAGWKIVFVELAGFVRVTFNQIAIAMLEPILGALTSIALGMQRMGKTLQNSANPAVSALGDSMREMARGLIDLTNPIERALSGFVQGARTAARETSRANREIRESTKYTVQGIDEEINKVFNAPQGKSFMREPLAAVKELGAELAKLVPNIVAVGEAKDKVNEKGGILGGSVEAAADAGRAAGGVYVSEFREALYSSQADVSNSIFDVLTGKTDKSPIGIYSAVTSTLASFAGASRGRSWGYAAGGEVARGGMPSLAHFARGVRGLAAGGRALGLAASDTVAAWLTPGEWVQPLRAVRAYGTGVMEAIRQVRIPPATLQALAGDISIPAPVATAAPRGYAMGGAVAGGGGSGSTTVQPVMLANEQQMETFLAGGSSALTRWLHQNGFGR